jgi:hypothetical protein
MRRTAALAVLGALALGAAGFGAQADRAALGHKQALLSAEYGLAKESQFYFVLDVQARRLELRVRGMVLRSWPLQGMRFWGDPDFAGAVEMVRKTALKAPERIVIKPGEAEGAGAGAGTPGAAPQAAAAEPATSGEYDLEALELKDMPRRFSLDFDNGLRIQVLARNGGPAGLLGKLADAWHWYVGLPLRNLFGSRDGRKISELELSFERDQDAQAIYWHFFDGIKGLIR